MIGRSNKIVRYKAPLRYTIFDGTRYSRYSRSATRLFVRILNPDPSSYQMAFLRRIRRPQTSSAFPVQDDNYVACFRRTDYFIENQVKKRGLRKVLFSV